MKLKIHKSIRIKLTLWFILIFTIIIFISNIILYKSFKKSMFDSIDNTLYMIAEDVEHAILKISQQQWRREIRSVKDEFLTNRFFIQVLEKSKTEEEKYVVITKSEVLSNSVYPISKNKVLKELKESPKYLNIKYKRGKFQPMRLILFPVIKENNSSFVILVSTSLKKTFQTINKLLIIRLISGPIIIVLSSIGGYLILTRAINPVKKIVETAKKITAEDLSHRIKLSRRSDEIGELASTLNQMIERLEKSVNQIKQFSSDVSHELKTPLTVIMGETGISLRKKRPIDEYRKALKIIHEQAENLEKVINDLLFLSQIEFQERKFSFEKIVVFEVLLSALKEMESYAQKKKVQISLKRIDQIHFQGVELLLKRMFLNLIENAIKYTNSGGWVDISFEDHDNHALFKIKDTGIGIPAESIPFIFDRFYRVDKYRSKDTNSFGLGLSIVKWVVNLHKAEIEIHSEIGIGTVFSINFPISEG